MRSPRALPGSLLFPVVTPEVVAGLLPRVPAFGRRDERYGAAPTWRPGVRPWRPD